jgi:peroxiredoxin Q/BCP
MISIGKKAPEFSLSDQTDTSRSLSDYRGKWVLLYFYPKDDTPGCTVEACTLRDNLPKFKTKKLEVLGVSKDSVESHKKFAAKYKLPFTLLADPEKKVMDAYGAWGKKKFMGREYMGTLRISFLIDPKGIVRKVYPKVKPPAHAQEVLADLDSFLKKTT